MISLKILTVEKTVFEGEVSSLIAPGTVGYFEILSGHAAMISTLQPGRLVLKLASGEKSVYAISGGAFQVYQNRALILGQAVESASEIDFNRAEEAYRNAYRLLEMRQMGIDEHAVSLALLRAKNRMKIAKEVESNSKK